MHRAGVCTSDRGMLACCVELAILNEEADRGTEELVSGMENGEGIVSGGEPGIVVQVGDVAGGFVRV
jgi:hypothetical protein